MGWTPERMKERVEYDLNGGCWLWTGWLHDDGYGRIQVGDRRTGAHRVSYEIFKGPIPSGAVVMHTCDVPCCVNPDHLRVGTQIENIADRHRKGRSSRAMGRKGSLASGSILNEEQVVQIKSRLLDGEDVRAIASDYPVKIATIHAIKRGKIWKHINVV